MSYDNLPPELLAKHRKPWMSRILGGLMVCGLLLWWLGPMVRLKSKSYLARYYADQTARFLEKKEWLQAHQSLEKAQSWRADHPRVLRVLVDFLIATQGDPMSILHHLRLIEVAGGITEEDLLKVGQIYVQMEDAAGVRQTLEKLPPAARERRPALELLANLQRLQGRGNEAEQTLRRALSLDKNDSMCQLRLAVMDQQAAFEEIRLQARQSLWRLCAGLDKAALIAIETLASDKTITPLEADLLTERIESHPHKTESLRLLVLSSLARVRPEKKASIIEAEVHHMDSLKADDLMPHLLWLLMEKQPQRIVEFRPREFYSKSSLLIQPYLQSLGDLGRWEEVDKLLARPAGIPVSSGFISLWRARATRHLDHDTSRTRQHLAMAYEATGHGRDASTATAAAALAEEVGVWDVAVQLYNGLAEHQPKSRIVMLEKVRDVALRGRDTDALITAMQKLTLLRPDNSSYLRDIIYLHLVSGQEIEVYQHRLTETLTESGAGADATHLCLALAAYRFGDMAEVRQQLTHLLDPRALSPGQRAVHAGLLSLSGQLGPAFQIAEQVPLILLLKEEEGFLMRAL